MARNASVKSSQPVMQLLELMGKKWMLRIVWELSKEEMTFRELQAACGDISPTIINRRLKEMVEAKLVEKRDPSGYGLTDLGKEFCALVGPLNQWSKKWVKKL